MQELVFIEKGQAVTDSLTISEVFEKRHSDVIRDIEVQLLKLEDADEREFGKRNFALSAYESGTRKYKKYNLTEDAFAIIVMAYVTPQAMKFKVKFIQEFKRIKEQLQRQFNVPTSFSEALRLAADLQEKIELDKPKVEAHDKFISGVNLQKVGQVAKALKIGRNKLFAFLREEKVFMTDNTPYQKYIDRGYFEVKEKPIEMGSQVINKPQTFVTAKGVDFISKILDKKIA
ncbi:phage antirepressor KilAC domain-containing protein [Cytobacillus horneckiae]|uniref:Rha family transcriptional regulator n=1 Tax=Cytobacillus horneckiae TaxID=549687 RepID=UPI0039A26E51